MIECPLEPASLPRAFGGGPCVGAVGAVGTVGVGVGESQFQDLVLLE